MAREWNIAAWRDLAVLQSILYAATNRDPQKSCCSLHISSGAPVLKNPKGPRTQIIGLFRAQIPLILEYLGPKTRLFGSLDP